MLFKSFGESAEILVVSYDGDNKLMNVRRYFTLPWFSKHSLKIVRKVREGDDSIRSSGSVAVVNLRIWWRLLPRCAKNVLLATRISYMAFLIFSCFQTGNTKRAANAAIEDPIKVSTSLSPIRFLNSTGLRK